jgi:hypothetical protein
VRRYLLHLFAGLIVLIFGTAVLTLLADPYSVYGTPRIVGLNAKKPYASTRTEEAKLSMFKRADSNQLFLGDSRIDIGFDPEAMRADTQGTGIFNFGVPGAGLSGLSNNYKVVTSIRAQPHVVVGLDFVDFLNTARKKPAPQTGPWSDRLRKIVERNLSNKGLQDSVMTIASQKSNWANNMSPNGFNNRRGFDWVTLNEGAYALFEDKNVYYSSRIEAKISGHEMDLTILMVGLEQFETLVEELVDKSEKVWVFNYPYHQEMHNLFDEYQLTDLREVWVREVRRILSEQKFRASDTEIRFVEIPIDNQWSVERVPQKGRKGKPLKYFWESVHFRPIVGQEIYRLFFLPGCYTDFIASEVSLENTCSSPLMTVAERTSSNISRP